MLLNSPWVVRLAEPPGTVCDRLVRAIAMDVAEGILTPGTRLPAHRDIAWKLGLSLGTVTKAMTVLARRGLVHGVNGRGTFVAGDPGLYAGRVDLSANVPPRLITDRMLAVGLNSVARRLDAGTFSSYLPPGGRDDHRRLLADWLCGYGVPASFDRLLLCNGAQHALAIALTSSCRSGGTLLTEALTYPGALAVARRTGARTVALPMDKEGVLPDDLARELAAADPSRGAVVYLTPTLQNPTGATMGAARRRRIADLCRMHDATIVEDDIHCAFRPSGLPPVAALAPERTLHVAGLSKVLSPGLRVGSLLVPAALMARASDELKASSTSAPILSCLIMAEWLADGTAQQVASAIVGESVRRHALARDRFPGLVPEGTLAGFHLWLPMPVAVAETVAERADRLGVTLPRPVEFLASEAAEMSGIRVSIGGPSMAELERALDIVAKVVAHCVRH